MDKEKNIVDPGLDNQHVIIQFLLFKLEDGEYLINIAPIVEIINYTEPKKVPQSYEKFEGVVDLRGAVIPVIDLAKYLGIKNNGHKILGHILIVNFNDSLIGLSVEKVLEVKNIVESKIQKPNHIMKAGDKKQIVGFLKIGDRIIYLLDFFNLLRNHEEKYSKQDDSQKLLV